MLLPKNTLLKEVESGIVWRVLDEVASTETTDTTSTHVVLIDINASRGMPVVAGKLKTVERVADRELVVVEEQRPVVNLENLSPAERARVERRWALWLRVKEHGHQLYEERFRGALARKLVEEGVGSKPFVYTTLRLLWQRGGGMASLVTGYANCGAPGKRRIAADGAPKPGRPRSAQPGVGVAATETHRRNMRLGWSRSPVGKNGKGLRAAWSWMLIARYSEHVSVTPKKDKQTIKIANYDAVPTFEQFEYHWKEENSFEQRKLNRLQQHKFDLAFKPLLTGTLPEVRGPGTRYYIDATVLDVYCVSRLNRNRIVGRPTLYVVVDQFSRMIVGIYVGLEPPCWVGAMLALWNCSIDKVAFCKAYGVEVTSDQWPTGHMPVHLMGDRGELASAQADALSQGFNLDVENATPYAGEAKGVAERVFGTLQTKFGPYMPGYVDKEFSGRGTKPAALNAVMDISDVTRTIIYATLHANCRVVKDYDGWPEVIAAGVPFVPVALWKWGADNLRCDVRTFPEAHLKRYLWPQRTAKLKRKALQFHRGLYYMGVDLRSQPWFAKSFIERSELPMLYHPLEMGQAVVIAQGERTGMYDVQLTRRSERFGNVSLSELKALEIQRKQQDADADWNNLPARLGFEAQMHETVKQAKRQAAQHADPTLSDAGRRKAIRANRADEIADQTSEALIATYGSDPTGRTIDVVATEVPSHDGSVNDAVRKKVAEQRRLAG